MKNLNFLSNLWRLSRASQSSDVGFDCRSTVVRPSFDRRSAMLKLVSVLVLILTIGSGNVWGAIDANSTWTATAFASLSDDATVIILNNFGNAIPNADATGSGPLKVAASYNGTTHKISVSTTGKTLDNIVWTVKKTNNGTKFYVYGSTTKTLGMSGTGSNTAVRVNSGLSHTEFVMGTYLLKHYNAARYVGEYTGGSDWRSYNSETANNYKSSGTQQTLTFYVLDAATPTVTPTPTSLGWGTVLQGSSQSTKTITITGANLTTGTLTISATGGYSVTPTSKSVSGTLAATTLTVTPPSTSTTGAKNGKVTISGGGLASNVEVDLSMTVNAASTVTWMNNGSEYTTTLVANGSKPEFPDNPSSCDGTSTTFVGWTPTPWSGKLDDVSSKTIYTSSSAMPNVSGPVTYHAVFAKSSGSETEHTLTLNKEKFYDAGATSSGYANTDLTIDGIVMKRSQWGWQQNGVNVYLQGKSSNAMYNDTQLGYIKSIAITKYGGSGNIYVGTSKQPTTNETAISTTTLNYTKSNNYTYFRINSTSTLQLTSVVITYVSGSVTYSKYLTTCCADPGLAYGTASVTKTYGASAFTNPLTNSHSVGVTYSSSDPTVATVNGSGQVTILKAGSTTITASSIAQTVSTVDYCADEASYTLTVNKADISPTLTYSPASVAVGENSSAPSVSGNTGSGIVSYAITSATPAGCATINASTGVVTGVAVGSVTVTATVAATANYNGGTATANVTITAASGYCISAFNSSNNGITSGFSNGGSGNEYTLSYTIPDKDGSSNWPQYWIGENEAWASFSASALFADMHVTTCDATIGLAEGATGRLHIWDNNKADGSNLWVKFEPSGYGLRWGGADWSQAANTKAFTVDAGDANVYWTDIVTLDGTNNTTWNYYVGLQTASGYVYSGVDNEASDSRGISRTRSVTAMKVSNGTAGSWKGTYLSSEPTGSRGKFRIWNNNIDDYNFYCHWVPFYRVTYDGSGASGSTAASADVCCEGNAAARTVKAAANGFTVPTGKSFGGWASSPENAAAKIVAYAANADVTLTGSITLYAIWNDIDYTVTVNQSPSVGATTTGQTSTAHYNGTINLTTTIPDGYRFVNWTSSDVTITNPTSATTASFTMPAKNVTVTANFQQTHKVDWYVGGSAPANKIGDDGQTTVVDHGGKIEDFPATTPDGSPCDKTFVGWTNTSSYVHGTSPLFNDVAGSPTINADAQFYAVYATEGESGDPTNKFSVTLNVASPSAPSGYTLSQATEWKNSTHRQDGSNDPAYIKIYHTSTKLFSSLPTTITIKAGLYGGTARDMSEDGSDYYPYVFFTDNAGNEIAGSAKAICTSVTTSSDEKSVNMDVSKATNAYGIGIRHKKITGFNLRYSSITLAYAETSYTGHTITCTSCSNEVTVSFSAPGSGNTMTVAKGVTSISSGDAVKTCSAVSLTVTLTPAAHYTVTNFTATGVTGVTTSNVGNVYTVNIPADKTGTLTLTPTFTAETPLTITLDTHSKGTFTPIGTIYSGDSFTFPEVTPNDAECADFVGWVEGTSIAEEGTSTEPTTIAAGSSSGTLTTNKTYTAVYAEKDKTETDAYVKVTSSLSNWSGTYLIVHEGSSRALDGSLTSDLGSTGDYFSVSITDGAIAATSTLATKNWTIAKIGETSTYTIKSASGYYIGRATASNGLDKTTTAGDADANSITYSSGVSIAGSASTAKLQYWVSGANACFKYYTSSQNAVSLYKLGTAEVVTYTYTVNPACTAKYRVTVNSATGGSPTADPKYLPEGETVTLTANPAAGYTFTSWTITKTTGGDNVTSTLLTGDKPTTANTSFAMPAYDVTVTATYAKIYVTSVVAKDGETVLNTTDSKLNVHTGANKTVTVVVTPADAFDHSWSAEVTSGGTYASINNVTEDGFRVNGLAEGDATIVVTAPNDDGTDRTATFTVHVTDILPEEIILKRDGSNTPIETLIMYYDETNSKGQYVKVNVGYSPANPTNKAFTFSSALTGKVGSHSHAPASGYEVLVANGVTSDAVNCTFTSSADGSVTKVLAVTVLPILSDRFVDYVHGNATQTVSARLSDDRYSIIPDINTPSLSDASDADPTSEDCETAHYHLVGWLPQTTAEALWAAGTPITDATEGLVRAGESVEATGQTWCAIWAEEQ